MGQPAVGLNGGRSGIRIVLVHQIARYRVSAGRLSWEKGHSVRRDLQQTTFGLHGLDKRPSQERNRAALSRTKTRHQFVTKTRPFMGILELVRNGKAREAKGFSFLTTQLTQHGIGREHPGPHPRLATVEKGGHDIKRGHS